MIRFGRLFDKTAKMPSSNVSVQEVFSLISNEPYMPLPVSAISGSHSSYDHSQIEKINVAIKNPPQQKVFKSRKDSGKTAKEQVAIWHKYTATIENLSDEEKIGLFFYLIKRKNTSREILANFFKQSIEPLFKCATLSPNDWLCWLDSKSNFRQSNEFVLGKFAPVLANCDIHTQMLFLNRLTQISYEMFFQYWSLEQGACLKKTLCDKTLFAGLTDAERDEIRKGWLDLLGFKFLMQDNSRNILALLKVGNPELYKELSLCLMKGYLETDPTTKKGHELVNQCEKKLINLLTVYPELIKEIKLSLIDASNNVQFIALLDKLQKNLHFVDLYKRPKEETKTKFSKKKRLQDTNSSSEIDEMDNPLLLMTPAEVQDKTYVPGSVESKTIMESSLRYPCLETTPRPSRGANLASFFYQSSNLSPESTSPTANLAPNSMPQNFDVLGYADGFVPMQITSHPSWRFPILINEGYITEGVHAVPFDGNMRFCEGVGIPQYTSEIHPCAEKNMWINGDNLASLSGEPLLAQNDDTSVKLRLR